MKSTPAEFAVNVDCPRPEDVPGSVNWWGKESLGKTVLDAARDRVRFAYENFDDIQVSFSGGKDSTAVLNVTVEVARELDRLPVRAIFYDEECISLETVDYCRRVSQLPEVALEWYCLPVRHRNACSDEQPFWWPWAPEARDLWVRELPPEGITELEGFEIWPEDQRRSIPDTDPLVVPKGNRRSAVLMGIRADESMTRRRAVANRRPENFVIPTVPGVSKVYPIYDWSTEDVWTAPAKLGWDVNATYDIFEMAGISHSSQRCAPPFGEEPMGQLWMWAVCFPDLWAKMCDRVPGAAAAARYSRTELYSFGGDRKEKPPGITWQEFIRQRLAETAKSDPELAKYTAYKVRETLRRHYKKTTDPLMPTARHPYSGISWEWLYMLADRQDTKDRKQMMEVMTPAKQEQALIAYQLERAAVEAGEVEL